ncbi:hypothetical protein NX801_22145 [Streptomyces sp. LP05-1]|uniref:Uncharacterized protein n=1 Tax=Streptomyces pyxinae TaxID=2970734 RepID=A0ABT2CLL3_9ACTN|nr:hypothetical protein [Streptomyces sp. LP05-1]MCS0638304.1 hypothetical protein [Streptomyces sp. LP05-1]
MSRRVSLPGADELFRTTGGTALQASTPAAQRRQNGEPRVPAPAGESDPAAAEPTGADAGAAAGGRGTRAREHTTADAPAPAEPRARTGEEAPAVPGKAAPGQAPARRRGRAAGRRPSGRERHDEKITVYVSAEELMDLEHARLVLRGEHGLAVDRGRIVREAVAVVLADLESRGEASILVRRLRGR